MGIRQVSLADPYAIAQRSFDEQNDAQRVVIVGGNFEMPKGSAAGMQIERVEVPFIVEKEKIVYVDKPIIVKETVIERIEIPVIVKEQVIEKIVEVVMAPNSNGPSVISHHHTEYKDLPKWMKICLVAQMFTTMILLLKMIF